MKGLHLTADLRGCNCDLALLCDSNLFAPIALDACQRAGLSVVSSHWHGFGGGEVPSGYTGVLLLAESHLAVHTWPELAGVTLDVYVCNYSGDNSAKARELLDRLVGFFAASEASRHELQRGFGAPLAVC